MRWKPLLFVDPDLERAQRMANRFRAQVEEDYRTAMGEFDAAILSVPHTLHAPICTTLLENGKHVFVEKPLSTTAVECEKIVEAEKRGKAKVAVGLFRRYLKGAQWVKSFLESGALGQVETFDFREGSIYAWPVTSDSYWRKAKAGGGVLMDTGAHTLDLLIWWLGEAEVIDYVDDSYGGVEADCLISLMLKSGGKGEVELSRTRDLRGTAIIKGQRGALEVSLTKNEVRANPLKFLSQTHNGFLPADISPQSPTTLIADEIRDWLNVIHSKAEPFVSALQGARSIALIDQCYRRRRYWDLPWVHPD